MARRNKGTTTEEENVTTTTPEATDVAPEATEAPAEPTAEVDLSEFESALGAAIEAADDSTGTVAEADRAPVVAAYRALSGAKAKAAARALPDERMKDAMLKGEFTLARAYMEIKDSLTSAPSGGGSKRERTPANPTETFVEQDAALRIATAILESTPPTNLDEDWEEKVNGLIDSTNDEVQGYIEFLQTADEDRGEAPEVSTVVQRAVKLAAGRAAGRRASGSNRAPYTGTRRDVAKHILEAFEEVGNGEFLTVAEIVKHNSSEYGDDKPSAGAVSARLFPKDKPCNIEGITPGNGPDGKSRGAYKGNV